MPLTRADLRDRLSRRDVAPVYALFGPETYLRDLAAKKITDAAFDESDFRDFNDAEFSLNTPENLKSALAAADQLPMMASRRVIRVRDVRVASTAAKDTLKEEFDEALAAYLANPSPSSVVIFVADELNGVRKMGKLLREKATSVEFAPLSDQELTQWARQKVKDAGSEMDDRSLRHLTALTGSDARRLTVEIEKLSTAALPGKVIDFNLVDDLVANVREISNFDLSDNLVAGNKAKALQILEKILNDGAEPLALLGLISYSFRRLLMAKDMMERGVQRSEVARIVKLRYSDQEPFLAAARRVDKRRLMNAVTRLAETDLAIKTSIGGPGAKGARAQIEVLVCELATA